MRNWAAWSLMGAACVGLGAFAQAEAAGKDRLEVVRRYADKVLETGRDRYGPVLTPLLADGVNVDTLSGVIWRHQNSEWVVSNLANQQNLFRMLVGLSSLTKDEKYRQTAKASIAYHFERLRNPCGLLKWGGHRFIDLRTESVQGEQNQHELKCVYPFYELMWEVDPKATELFIKALWNGHVLDWGTLDMNRHGKYDLPMGKLWENSYTGTNPYFEGKGLTFLNSGSDMVYSAAVLFRLTGDQGALRWAKRLAQCYVDARDPKTKLGAYQYSQRGDRAQRQFGPEFGPIAMEGKLLNPHVTDQIYGRAAIVMLRLGELLGDDGKEFITTQQEGLRAFARYVYDPKTNLVKAMFTDLTPIGVEHAKKRPGYYDPKQFEPRQASSLLLLSYALAWRLTRDEELWQTARSMARWSGLGDIGSGPGKNVALDLRTNTSDPLALFALLEIVRAAEDSRYMTLAERLGDNIVARRLYKGFFLPGKEYVNANFDTLEPLALLTLEATVQGRPAAVPAYPGGNGAIQGPHDGLGRTYDHIVWWSKQRE